jgi:serine/threonine protein kinase
VLKEKYHFKEAEAHAFADFLLPMLHWDPDKRASAQAMLNHPWLTMPANNNAKLTNEEYTAQKTNSVSTDVHSDHYMHVEMSKLTDSEGEYHPADEEDCGYQFNGNSGIKARKFHKEDKLEAFFERLDDSDQSINFSDEDKPRPRQKMFRDLAEGQNLNNSFGCYAPEDWEHLHVDKGMNPQFNVLKQGKVGAPLLNNFI